MNKYKILSLVCFILGVIFLSLGVLSGDVETGFVLIFPVLIGEGFYAFLGFIFIFLAVFLFMLGYRANIQIGLPPSYPHSTEEKVESKKKTITGGGVVLIGPIPIIFGSNWKIAIVMMILAIILIIIGLYTMNIF